jgi:hypothetical protein
MLYISFTGLIIENKFNFIIYLRIFQLFNFGE